MNLAYFAFWIAAPELVVALAVAYALRHGGKAERWSVAGLAVSWTVYSLMLGISGHTATLDSYILIECCNSIFFLLLAFAYGELWTGLILFGQAAMLGSLGLQINNPDLASREALTNINDLSSLATVLVVLGSVFSSKHRLMFRRFKALTGQAAFRAYIETAAAADGPCQIDLDYRSPYPSFLAWLRRGGAEVSAKSSL